MKRETQPEMTMRRILYGQQVKTESNSMLRTISLRLVGTEEAKEQLEELGEEAVTITQSKMRDVIMAATKVESNDFQGFDILDENGNYKSTYEILQGIADIYDEIVETDKEFGTNNLNLLLENLANSSIYAQKYA